jgi:mRNA-degrading endonuclease toxin of MazEF toxin-antitoxin module
VSASTGGGCEPRGFGLFKSGFRTFEARGVYTGKPRPVVIIQDDRFDATASVTVCPLTTNPVEAPLTRIALEPTTATGIEQPGRIMVDKITTMPRGNVRDPAIVLVVSRMQMSSDLTAHSSCFSGWPNDLGRTSLI